MLSVELNPSEYPIWIKLKHIPEYKYRSFAEVQIPLTHAMHRNHMRGKKKKKSKGQMRVSLAVGENPNAYPAE